MATKVKLDENKWYEDNPGEELQELFKAYGMAGGEEAYQEFLDLFESDRCMLDNERYLNGSSVGRGINEWLEKEGIQLKAVAVDTEACDDGFLWKFVEHTW